MEILAKNNVVSHSNKFIGKDLLLGNNFVKQCLQYIEFEIFVSILKLKSEKSVKNSDVKRSRIK